jgi:hypothetical protein
MLPPERPAGPDGTPDGTPDGASPFPPARFAAPYPPPGAPPSAAPPDPALPDPDAPGADQFVLPPDEPPAAGTADRAA